MTQLSELMQHSSLLNKCFWCLHRFLTKI
ncbi:unnamed protein product [Spirodela intermedia]|uniref:Uncharacterized protein n=2 Tax=Spirodela intermedia TaxID=51605 RepID=A0A7I8KU18_SPIIN|nr:unnamed protein product [Spirodela intermedia]CAA6663977.1 unnamed protein product [Spirodela intermedia]CAA7400494.1 unnamed protein product [Spirodela intermedia]